MSRGKAALILCWLATASLAWADVDVDEAALLNQALVQFGYSDHQLQIDGDDIHYYLHQQQDRPQHLVLFIQGTDPFPLFFYQRKEDGPHVFKAFNDDDQRLPPDTAYAVVAKPALSGIREWQHFDVPQAYQDANYRERRVRDLSAVIDDIRQRYLAEGGNIIVYGHSEGAQIAAALARQQPAITHLGFWSGNVLNNFYEFALFERLAVRQGLQSDAQAQQNIDALMQWYQAVLADPDSTEVDDWGFTNRRWASYRHAPLEDLLALELPIYAQFASNDDSTPIETAYLLPVQFLSAGKTNLDFHVCLGCDHSYVEERDEGAIDHWPSVFDDFLQWTQSQPE